MQMKRVPGGFFVVLDKGEEIVQTLTDFAGEHRLVAGALTGIGAVEDVTLGFFDRQSKAYEKRLFEGEYELVALDGNISLADGAPFVHAHCALGGRDYALVGGHLFSGTVAVTAEVHVRIFDAPMERKLDLERRLRLLSL